VRFQDWHAVRKMGSNPVAVTRSARKEHYKEAIGMFWPQVRVLKSEAKKLQQSFGLPCLL